MAVLDYSNREGKRKTNLSIGNPFDRHSWKGQRYEELLASPLIMKLWDVLVTVYTEHCAPFLRDRGVPEEVTPDLLTHAIEHIYLHISLVI